MATQLKRPLTVKFSKKNLIKVVEKDIIVGLTQVVDAKQIKAVQLTQWECRVTFTCEEAKEKVKNYGINIGHQLITPQDADICVTNVTIKDAPVELDDRLITTCLSDYGQVIQGSLKRGVIKDTEIENGTRYVQMLDITEIVPNEMIIGSYTIRVFCDNGKTECIHCTKTDHPSYKCPSKQRKENRKCNNCYGEGHLSYECQNETVCRYCGQTGHKQYDCEEWREVKGRRNMRDLWRRDDSHRREDEDVFEVQGEKVNDEMQTDSHKMKTVLIGDSVISRMKMGKSNVSVQSESGARVGDMSDILEMEDNIENASEVVVHLGINDICDDKADIADTYIVVTQQVQKIKEKMKGKPIVLSSVLPVKGKGKEKENAKIGQLNNYLKRLCDKEEDVYYQENSEIVLNTKGEPDELVYRKKDTKGIHLNDEGTRRLAQHIGKTIKQIRDESERNDKKRQRSDVSSTPPSAHLKSVKQPKTK